MRLTPEQRRAVISPDSTLLEACPGSGKTRTIVAKLIRCIDDVRGTSRRVACITYTNAAVEEIENRLRLYGAMEDEVYGEVTTIHTFCLANVLGSFYWRIPCYRNGVTVLPPESSCFESVVLDVLREHNLPTSAKDAFGELNREPDGTPIMSDALTEDAVFDFWRRLEEAGLIDFSNIVYRSFQILRDNPSIAEGLACRFSWILIDEFQDTSALQVEILKLIAQHGLTKFFLVGDPFQSIYRFAGARPTLMDDFAAYVAANSDYHLTENFRCSAPIIADAERLLPRRPPMHRTPEPPHYTERPRHVHGDDSFSAVTDHFIPALDHYHIPYGRAAILAPTWFGLYRLGRQLREYGLPVFGIGARPYSRGHAFGLIAEPICSFLANPSADKIGMVEKELFIMLTQITNRGCFDVFSYRGRVVICRLLQAGEELQQVSDSGSEWLVAAAERFTEILVEEEFLPKHQMSLLPESVSDMHGDMQRRGVDIPNLTVEDLGLFADPEHNLKLLTIHRAKGREFHAVAIVDLHEGRLPHWRDEQDPEALAESRRKLYVAITRAERLLMYITDQGDRRNRPSRFLLEQALGQRT